MMKKTSALIALILTAALLLTGCVETLFTTKEYRKYSTFAEQNRVGMTKEQVMETLGSPDVYRDAEGNAYYRYRDKETYEEKLCSAESATWCFECYKLPDPAEPYRLWISFDDQGKLVEVEFVVVYGG